MDIDGKVGKVRKRGKAQILKVATCRYPFLMVSAYLSGWEGLGHIPGCTDRVRVDGSEYKDAIHKQDGNDRCGQAGLGQAEVGRDIHGWHSHPPLHSLVPKTIFVTQISK